MTELYRGYDSLRHNTLIGNFAEFKNSSIEFSGKGNVVVVEECVKLINSSIQFEGENALLFICSSKHDLSVSASIGCDSTLFIGNNLYVNVLRPLRIVLAERRSAIIGDNALISFGVSIEAVSGNVIIGNHCWFGEEASVVGPSCIGGGCVIGASSQVASNDVDSFRTVVAVNRVLPNKSIHANDPTKNKGRRARTRLTKAYADAIKADCAKPVSPYIEPFETSDSSAFIRALAIRQQRAGYYNHSRLKALSLFDKSASEYVQLVTSRLKVNNHIVGNPKLIESSIVFHGSNNTFICDEGITLENSTITFTGDNGVAFFGCMASPHSIAADISTDSTLVLSRGCKIEGKLSITASEGKNVVIGEDCSFGNGCWIRTSDQHGIYDFETLKRTNRPKSTVIEPRSSFGEHCQILKGTHVNEGCNITSSSRLSNRAYKSQDDEVQFDSFESVTGDMARLECQLSMSRDGHHPVSAISQRLQQLASNNLE